MAKAKAAPRTTEATRYVYVTRGIYAGQFLQMAESTAETATGDQWGLSLTEGASPVGFDTSIPEGWNTGPYDLPQSLIDFQNAALPEPPLPPEPVPAPVLTSLSPNTAELDGENVTMSAIGENFTADSRIVFADHQENTVFVSDTELTTIVTTSLEWGAVSVPVFVRTGDQVSETLDFTFTEAPPVRASRS